MRIMDALNEERTITVKMGKSSFKVTYDPNKMSVGNLRRMMRDAKNQIDGIEDEFERGMAELMSPNALALSMHVTGWSLQGPFEDIGEDEPIPCTLQYMELLPDTILETIIEAVKKDNEGPKSRRNS